MNPNTIKNLTYAAVALCVMTLVYLVYNSIKQAKLAEGDVVANVNTEETMKSDDEYQIKDGESTDAATPGVNEITQVRDDEEDYNGDEAAVEGKIVPGKKSVPTSTVKTAPTAGLVETTVEDNDVIDVPDAPAKSSSRKGIIVTTPKTTKPAATTAAASSGQYLVVAGAFSNQENAQVMLKSIQKLGYTKAAVVKFKNSPYSSICVDKFDKQADANNLVKQLKTKNVTAYARLKKE